MKIRSVPSWVLVVVFVVAMALAPLRVAAQLSQGSIFGTVKDSSGAVVPGVMVTVTETDTGVARTVTSDSMGQYSVLELTAGNYGLTAQQQGFQTIHLTQMVLAVGQNARYDLNLKVGSATQAVTVTSEAPLVETTNATLSSEVTNKQLVDLPLNGRSFTDLVQLGPGADWATSAIPPTGIFLGKGPRLTINGAGVNSNLWYIDGTLMNDNYNRTPAGMAAVMLGVDAVDEFKSYLSTNNADLPGAGGVIDIITKSGTNNFHGDAFIFERDRALDSRDFFDPQSGPPPFSRQQFGGTVGGPIKKDKLFFFLSFEQFRQVTSANQTYLVPDYLSQQGMVPNGSGGREQITVSPIMQQEVFPMWGHLLPTASTPASAEDGNTGYDFVTGIQRSPIVDTNYEARLDYHPSSNDSIFSRFTFDEGDGDIYSSASYLPNFPEYQFSRGLYYTLGYTKIFSANLVNRVTFSYTAPILDSNSAPTGALPPVSIPGKPSVYEQISITGGPTIGGNQIDPFININSVPQVSDEVTYTLGKHTIKFGANYARFRTYSFNGDFNSGTWAFANLTSFLEGIPNTFSFQAENSTTARNYHQRMFGTYVTDEWKVTPRLTANYGLRYDVTSGPTDPQGRESYLPNPLNFPGPCNFSSTEPLGVPGVPYCPGTGPSNFVTGSYWPKGQYLLDFQPRAGLAWDVRGDGKTVVRAGAGIYDQQILEDFYVTDTYTAPFTITGVLGPPTTAPLTAACFPTPITTTDAPVPGCPAANLNGSSRLVLGAIKDPTIYRWNLTVQRQLDRATSFSVSYVGSQGRHQPREASNINVPNPVGTVDGEPVYPGYTNSTEINSTACVKAGGCIVAPNVTVDNSPTNCWLVGNNCLANPNFGSLSGKSLDGYSSYNSLQVEVDRRAKSFNLQASYVWSKCIDSGGVIYNDFSEGGVVAYYQNIGLDKGVCGFDQRQRLAANFTYQLPGPSHGLAGKTLGGWEYANNLTIATGPPFSVSGAVPNANFPYQLTPGGTVYAPTNFPSLYASTPLVVPGVKLINPGDANNYFNPAAVADPVPGYLNTARWLGRGPGLIGWNASLIKNVSIKEHAILQLRVEAFNVPNHPNLAFPTASPFSYILNPATGIQVLTTNATAGKITTTITPGQGGRIMQLGAKLVF